MASVMLLASVRLSATGWGRRSLLLLHVLRLGGVLLFEVLGLLLGDAVPFAVFVCRCSFSGWLAGVLFPAAVPAFGAPDSAWPLVCPAAAGTSCRVWRPQCWEAWSCVPASSRACAGAGWAAAPVSGRASLPWAALAGGALYSPPAFLAGTAAVLKSPGRRWRRWAACLDLRKRAARDWRERPATC